MTDRCPESGAEHEYDAGCCVYCDTPEPVVECSHCVHAPHDGECGEPLYDSLGTLYARCDCGRVEAPDAWLDMALEDALSGGMYT